jgi:oligoribonuclease NrnB/cAMP/cGMP phosphodiesterase (DHH superfamily)
MQDTKEIRKENLRFESFKKLYQPIEYNSVVIAHKSCPDGTASAFFCILELDQLKHLGIDQARYIERPIYVHFTKERDINRDKQMPSLVGKHVYIVDYSYPIEVLRHLSSICKTLILWDHHVTTIRELQNVDFPIELVLNEKMCGAEIVWNEVFGHYNRKIQPWFLKHIRDRDLWLWEDPHSKEFSAAFYEKGTYIDTLFEILPYSEEEQRKFYERGAKLLEIDKEVVNRICKNALRAELICGKVRHPVICVNVNFMQSEVGATLLGNNPDINIAMIYRYDLFNDEWTISLRSNNLANVEEICKYFNGGGHFCSGGFTYRGIISDILKLYSREIKE